MTKVEKQSLYKGKMANDEWIITWIDLGSLSILPPLKLVLEICSFKCVLMMHVYHPACEDQRERGLISAQMKKRWVLHSLLHQQEWCWSTEMILTWNKGCCEIGKRRQLMNQHTSICWRPIWLQRGARKHQALLPFPSPLPPNPHRHRGEKSEG